MWSSRFANGVADWPFSGSNWGDGNRSFRKDPAISGQVMSVFIAKGSVDPYTMVQLGLQVAGQGMKLKPPGLLANAARLHFKLKLPVDFQPALGGKLGPGLCGGACNGGGKIPDGRDGWSTRIGFDEHANVTVYAYLPSSQLWGTVIGKIALQPGKWATVSQEVKLNAVGQADGHIKVWVDGQLQIDQEGLLFRTTSALAIDGLYFDTFYGGQTPKFAAPRNTTFEFAEITVHSLP